jgi:hypothetical protein
MRFSYFPLLKNVSPPQKTGITPTNLIRESEKSESLSQSIAKNLLLLSYRFSAFSPADGTEAFLFTRITFGMQGFQIASGLGNS